jgi:hypothetical protein
MKQVSYSIEELECLTSTKKDIHPLDLYRKNFPNSERSTAALLSVIKNRVKYLKHLQDLKDYEILQEKRKGSITTKSEKDQKFIKNVINDEELRLVIGIKNEVAVIQNQFEELLTIQRKTFELFQKIDSSKSEQGLHKNKKSSSDTTIPTITEEDLKHISPLHRAVAKDLIKENRLKLEECSPPIQNLNHVAPAYRSAIKKISDAAGVSLHKTPDEPIILFRDIFDDLDEFNQAAAIVLERKGQMKIIERSQDTPAVLR